MGIIYKTTNCINGKIYIGKYEGSRETYLGSGTYLRRAILKHGRDNFKRTTIDFAENRQDLNRKEKFWISFFNAKDRTIGYNITEGGDGFTGQHSEESKKKIGIFHQGKARTDEDKLKISCGRKGMKFSDEHRFNMSMSRKEKRIGEENPFYGKHHSEESLQKMRDALRGRKSPMLGRHHSEESKAKMSVSRKGWPSPMKGKRLSLEARQKISESQIGRIPWNKGKKGCQTAWNKCRHISEEQKQKISETLRKKK